MTSDVRVHTYNSRASLRQQFGSNNADTINGRAQFRKDFLAALREVLVVYREANVEISKGGRRLTAVLSGRATQALCAGIHRAKGR